MNYSFDKQHAIDYGVDEAIVIHNFIHWIAKNQANKKHFHEGKYWTYNSVDAFKQLFEFWTAKQLRRIIESLVNQNVIMRGNFNKMNMDRTGWYAFVNQDAFLGIQHLPIQENGIAQKVKPLPNDNTNNKPLSKDNDSNMLNFDIVTEKSEFQVAFENFIKMRKSIRKPVTKEAIPLLKKEVLELSKGNDVLAIKIFNQSIKNSWCGLFPIKDFGDITLANNNYPDNFSKKFHDTLSGKALSEYWQYLLSTGHIAKRDRVGNILDWVKAS